MSLAHKADKIARLRDRAEMMRRTRNFFRKRDVLEVDVPALCQAQVVDAHIDPIQVEVGGQPYFLHTSPEVGLKEALTLGLGDCYQLGHVFRDGEVGSRHRPEFTLCEWYRIGKPLLELVRETAEFVQLFIGERPLHIVSYWQAFLDYAGIDYLEATRDELKELAGTECETRDDYLNMIMGLVIEPKLVGDEIYAITHYPASQAALSRTTHIGTEPVAERFELYFNGVELANGYHELLDPDEHRSRFHFNNCERQRLGKDHLPIPDEFLASLERGLPECSGVAVGFDRLMMVRHETDLITDVIY